MRKPVTPDGAGDPVASVRVDTGSLLVRRAPTLYQWLSDDRWDDGSQRATSTLLLFVEDGCLKGCLNDREGGRSVFVTADSVESLLDELEAGLSQDSLAWRAKPGQSKKGRK